MRFLLQKGKQKELINKEKGNLTWNQFSKHYGINRRNLLAYYNEETLIPEYLFKQFKSHDEFKKFILEIKDNNWGRILGGKTSRGSTKEINFPEDSKELSEFYGIMLGDGNSNKTKSYKVGTYMIRIVGDSRYDKAYLLEYVKPLIENLFKIEVKFGKFKNQNAIFLEAHSIKLINFLEKKGFKPGNKIKNLLQIPLWIKRNKDYLISCIRGLIDTDGSFYKLTNQNSWQINFKNFNEALLQDFREGLLKLGIKCSKISKNNSVYITKKEEIVKFFKLIGSKNSRHLNRFKMFKIAPSSSGQIQ